MRTPFAPLHRYSETENSSAEINMAHIRPDGGVIGLLFAAGTVCVFSVGIPSLRPFLAGAVLAGLVIALALGLLHKHRPFLPLTTISR